MTPRIIHGVVKSNTKARSDTLSLHFLMEVSVN